MTELEWFVGVDWGSRKHQVCILDAAGDVYGERDFDHGGAGLTAMALWIQAQTQAPLDLTGDAIEVPHGPVVEALMERSFMVHAINPKQLDRFRDRFSPAGAKEDRRDARALADALRTDRRFFRRINQVLPEVIALREQSRMADNLTSQRTALINRWRQQNWRYYPAFLDLGGDFSKSWILELWELVPTPAKARRVRISTVENLLRRHRVRRIDATQLIERLRQPAMMVAPGTTEAVVSHNKLLIAQITFMNRQLAYIHKNMDRLTKDIAARLEVRDDQPGIQQ